MEAKAMSEQHQDKNYRGTAGSLNLEMIWVPDGTFNMGCETGEPDEMPVHAVTLDAFWMGRCEVTNRQYRRFQADAGYDGAEVGGILSTTLDSYIKFTPNGTFTAGKAKLVIEYFQVAP